MSKNGPEYNEVQRPAWELLKDHFDYEYADGESSEFASERENETCLLRVLGGFDCAASSLLYWIKYVLPTGIAAMLIYGWVDALWGGGGG